ncbi:MAG: IS256 family transposase [Pseudomonadota bacterium]|nr:IS256 family transposase [Pseudomonadota bacterium]
MFIERERHLNAEHYERSPDRAGYANGYKPKTLKTRIGKLDLLVPQTRDSDFYPSCLERGMRSERALKLAVAEMYFQGVSTRKVKLIMEELCGFGLTSSEVSNAAKLLDDELAQWRTREIGGYTYVYLDAVYEKVRYAGHVRDCAVLIAVGIKKDGHRDILGLSVALSEHEVHWREFLSDLQQRGLHGVELIISDDHAGLKAARKAILPGIPWQRCHFHLQQNAQSYVTSRDKRREVGGVIRSILTAADLESAQNLLSRAIKVYEESMPKLASWMEKNIPEGFAHFEYPETHHRKIRTSNPLERLNEEVRRRTKVIGIFPNTESCERLISAVLMEKADEWLSGKRYLDMEA